LRTLLWDGVCDGGVPRCERDGPGAPWAAMPIAGQCDTRPVGVVLCMRNKGVNDSWVRLI
jgi:hypothetical protein